MKDIVSKVTSSVSFKFAVIGFLSLLLLIPVEMIKNLIEERQERSQEAVREVSEKWGVEQTITGPYLTIPLKEIRIQNGREEPVHTFLHVLPEDLQIRGRVVPEEKKRGIFRVVVYHSALLLEGSLRLTPELLEQVNAGELADHTAYLCLGLTDLRGIKDVEVRTGEEIIEEMPGLPTTDLVRKGIHVPLSPDLLLSDPLPFQITLELDGSRELYFNPVGKNTGVELASNWADPSFDGAFLPVPAETETGADGFRATWRVNYLNRSYPQHWFNRSAELEGSAFGVRFLIPVDHYQKSMRSIKYALMFIALSFLIFFLTELLSGIRLHPIQYLLVGMALVVFYTLLISLSEHLGFDLAYLISALATLVLISLYVRSSTGKIKQGLITGSLLLVLYAFLYTTLQMQDFSLLFGSIGIFLVIAIIMFVSRKVNWYREGDSAGGDKN